MALIECSNCNKMVSDTRDICVHCGSKLNKSALQDEIVSTEQSAVAQKDFNSFQQDEKDLLWDEFYEKNPRYLKLQNKIYTNGKLDDISFIDIILFIVLLIGCRYLSKNGMIIAEKYLFISAVVTLCALIKCVIISIYVKISNIIFKRKNLIVLKRFQAWLLNCKNINYVVKFEMGEKRQRKFFENINLEYEEY